MKMALCVATLFLLTCLPARASDVEAGSIAICDTLKRMERFTQLLDEDATVAMSAVNAEENDPNACALADIAYVQGHRLGVARSRSHAFQIVPILVVGTSTSVGYRPVTPALFFALVEVKEFAV
jgi:hypothetical protein